MLARWAEQLNKLKSQNWESKLTEAAKQRRKKNIRKQSIHDQGEIKYSLGGDGLRFRFWIFKVFTGKQRWKVTKKNYRTTESKYSYPITVL